MKVGSRAVLDGLDASRQNVDGESLASTRKMQTVERGGQREGGGDGRVWIVGNVEELKEKEETQRRDGFGKIL